MNKLDDSLVSVIFLIFHHTDPISSYLKKARKFARKRKFKRVFVVLALAGAAAAAYFLVLAK